MDSKLAEKLGEGFALAKLEVAGFRRGRGALEPVIGRVRLDRIIGQNREIAITISDFVDKKRLKILSKKADSTFKKLSSMQKIYLKKWKDAAEVLECLSFFEGSAIVHWSLISDMVGSQPDKRMRDFAHETEEFHRETMKEIARAIKSAD